MDVGDKNVWTHEIVAPCGGDIPPPEQHQAIASSDGLEHSADLPVSFRRDEAPRRLRPGRQGKRIGKTVHPDKQRVALNQDRKAREAETEAYKAPSLPGFETREETDLRTAALDRVKFDEVMARLDAVRPRTRLDCLKGGSNAQRPCPFVSCKYHLGLALEVKDDDGQTREATRGDKPTAAVSVKVFKPSAKDPMHPDLEGMHETCVLDIADRGGFDEHEQVAEVMYLHRQAVANTIKSALTKLYEHGALDAFSPTGNPYNDEREAAEADASGYDTEGLDPDEVQIITAEQLEDSERGIQ